MIPLVAIVINIILIAVVGNELLGRINSVRTETRGIKTGNETLEARVSTLRALEPEVSDNVAVVALAMPAEPPAVLAISTLKKLASDRNIEIKKLTIGTDEDVTGALPADEMPQESDSTLTSSITIEVGVDEYSSLIDFVRAISKSKPLMSLQSVKTKDNTSGGNIEVAMSFVAYYSPYPKSLPAVNQAISGLTASEEELLATLASFTSPNIPSDAGTPVAVPPRGNPFSLEI